MKVYNFETSRKEKALRERMESIEVCYEQLEHVYAAVDGMEKSLHDIQEAFTAEFLEYVKELDDPAKLNVQFLDYLVGVTITYENGKVIINELQ